MKILRREVETTAISQGGARIVRFIANTQTKDRHGTIVLPEGVQLENFWKNPVFCWSHPEGSTAPPDPDDVIGRVVAVDVSTGSMIIDVEFAPPEVNEKAERCYRAVQTGFLRAVSIGFQTLEEHLEGNGADQVTVISKWELLEVSLVIVGSNPDAVALRNLLTSKESTRGCFMTKKEAFQKLSLPEDASKEEAQKAYKEYAEKTEDDEDTRQAVKRAVDEMGEDKREDATADGEAKKEDEERALMTHMSREVKSLRAELGTLRTALETAQNRQQLEHDVARWIQEGRYPIQKRDKLLELHKQGKAKELVESIEPGTFAVPGKRMFVGGDPFQATPLPNPSRLNDFDKRVIAVFEGQGLKIDSERYLRDKQALEARTYA